MVNANMVKFMQWNDKILRMMIILFFSGFYDEWIYIQSRVEAKIICPNLWNILERHCK